MSSIRKSIMLATALLFAGVGVVQSADLYGGAFINLARSKMVGGDMKDAPFTRVAGRGLHLDLGYRFLYPGDAKTGGVRTSVGMLAVRLA